MPKKDSPNDSLSLIVLDDTTRKAIETRGAKDVFRAAAARLLPKRKDVSLAPVRADLERVQGQIDGLLADVGARTDAGGFRLDEVEVSLAISAEGSIGVATAGVEAAIALHFKRL
jgi:hypothetical protein